MSPTSAATGTARRTGLALALAAGGLVAPAPGLAAAAPDVSVQLDRATVAVQAGDRFRFRCTVRNDGDQPATGLLAHLNIASPDPQLYVDPEDWSAERTQYLRALPPGESVQLVWEVQAVGAGEFVLFVSAAEPRSREAVTGSPILQLRVTQERTLNAGNVLPVAALVPAGVLVLWAAVARRRRLRTG